LLPGGAVPGAGLYRAGAGPYDVVAAAVVGTNGGYAASDRTDGSDAGVGRTGAGAAGVDRTSAGDDGTTRPAGDATSPGPVVGSESK
ncbi:hypothetical protein, partial [Micromonospora sp. NPDC023633]|uniref:hypothetical protein n=1 Tax=Micromonospora sp. NPDC023633 TaxID=3154320 RepID=UPI0033C53D7C